MWLLFAWFLCELVVNDLWMEEKAGAASAEQLTFAPALFFLSLWQSLKTSLESLWIWKKETTIQSNRLRVRLDFQVPGETSKMAVNCFWRNKSQDIQRKHWIKIHHFAFTNGIICRGLFPLFVPIRATFAAVSNSPLAQSALLDRAGSQGFKLETLGYYLPDPGAATSQEHQCKGWRGQISRD